MKTFEPITVHGVTCAPVAMYIGKTIWRDDEKRYTVTYREGAAHPWTVTIHVSWATIAAGAGLSIEDAADHAIKNARHQRDAFDAFLASLGDATQEKS